MSFSTPFRRIDRATSVGVYYRIRIKWPVFCIWNRNSKSGTGSAGTSETGSAGTSETGIAGTSETGTAGSFGTGTAGTCFQSWACVSKIMSRLAPVRLFQTVSRLALSRIFKQKNASFSLSRHRVSRQ